MHYSNCIKCNNEVYKYSKGLCKFCYQDVNRARLSKRGSENPNWKGGTHITPWGYERYNPGGEFGGKFVHRVVMEKKIGRRLQRGEFVHHVNVDKLDNRPDNLEVVDTLTHNRIHRPDLKNIRHPKFGYYIKKSANVEDYSPHYITRNRNPETGRFEPAAEIKHSPPWAQI